MNGSVKSIDKILQISSRLEHLESAAEWVARETVHKDQVISQTASMICSIADDLRDRVLELVQEFENFLDIEKIN